ncbi:MAG: molecular chaperone HtpG [bacterium]|nr:molecular chaperone HtpG [bacterium]
MSENQETNTGKVQEFEYKAEMKQLLNIIIHSLYTHPEIFLRELISNSSDALNKVKYLQLTNDNILDKDSELKIQINIDEKEQTFTIEDNGVGMTQDDLVNNIGTIAKSGTLEFLEKLKEDKKDSGDLIGQFGVGFYSAFMVTDEVVIETRHAAKDSKGLKWTSSGDGKYIIEEIDKETRGTKISFKLNDKSKEFAQEYKVKSIVTKYSNFADFPIFLAKDKVNTVQPLWQKNKNDIKKEEAAEFYKFITNDFEEPLDYLHLSLEGSSAAFNAMLFIPKKAPFDLMRNKEHKTVQLYCNKIMIVDDCKKLLPEYLQFVRGIVDASGIPLNVSREMIQDSPIISNIQDILTSKIIGWIKDMLAKDKSKYLEFYKNFGPLLKMGVNTDFKNKDKIIDLLYFESSTLPKGEFVSLKEYVLKMQADQKEIYYLSGESREQLEKNPNLEYFKKQNIEVLFLSDPVDVFVVPSIGEYDKKNIQSIDKSDLDIKDDQDSEKENTVSEPLLNLFKETLKEEVEDVRISKRLVDSAATLVAGTQGVDKQMEQMMRMMGQTPEATKKIMEINMNHRLIKNLAKKYLLNADDPLIKTTVTHLFESAKLIDGDLESKTDYVKRMLTLMEKATE